LTESEKDERGERERKDGDREIERGGERERCTRSK
jgi:hypothetical protein